MAVAFPCGTRMDIRELRLVPAVASSADARPPVRSVESATWAVHEHYGSGADRRRDFIRLCVGPARARAHGHAVHRHLLAVLGIARVRTERALVRNDPLLRRVGNGRNVDGRRGADCRNLACEPSGQGRCPHADGLADWRDSRHHDFGHRHERQRWLGRQRLASAISDRRAAVFYPLLCRTQDARVADLA